MCVYMNTHNTHARAHTHTHTLPQEYTTGVRGDFNVW